MSIPWNGNWKGKLDRYKKLLSHAFNKPDDSLFKWYYRLGRAVSNQAQHPSPGRAGDLGRSQKRSLPERKALFYCHGGRTWNHVLESGKGEIKIILFKKLKGKEKRKITCQKILYYHGTQANCTRSLCSKQTALPDSCENFTLNWQPTSALITTSSAIPRKICSKSAS